MVLISSVGIGKGKLVSSYRPPLGFEDKITIEYIQPA